MGAQSIISGMNGSLEDFTYNNSDMADIFLEEMNHTSFEGVSVRVIQRISLIF